VGAGTQTMTVAPTETQRLLDTTEAILHTTVQISGFARPFDRCTFTSAGPCGILGPPLPV
jgi:hypothetical protein